MHRVSPRSSERGPIEARIAEKPRTPLERSPRSSERGRSTSSHTTTSAPKVEIQTEKRNVPSSVKSQVYKESGIPKAERKNYVIDHKVPLELGGSNSRSNLQAQPRGEAKNKDHWENYLTGQVKSGKMTVGQAQAEIQQAHSGPPPQSRP